MPTLNIPDTPEKREMEARQARLFTDYVRILTYQPQYAADFKRLNVEWIEKDFVLEAADLKMLDHPEGLLVADG
ncbi:hypothetical protein [Hymenobacter ruricola]|uniref:Uncharacterized protein n=1 Tax=Hymenobacter ruricola TaxID=2791023 RepID=A0ABS0I303_9BACT|nr:hypothetical protein [Hymenobacter ruricola]MBF9221336.1 hypothetical protein [Hymenobacter ruricola]